MLYKFVFVYSILCTKIEIYPHQQWGDSSLGTKNNHFCMFTEYLTRNVNCNMQVLITGWVMITGVSSYTRPKIGRYTHLVLTGLNAA